MSATTDAAHERTEEQMDETKKKGERKTLPQRIAAIDASIAFHQQKLDAARARKIALAGEKKKRAAMLLDEAATIERMVASTPTPVGE